MLCVTHTFPIISVLALTLAGKTHRGGSRERTRIHNIAYSVNEVIGSEDGSRRISVRLTGKVA